MNRTIEERNKLVEANLKLVYYVCKKMWGWAKNRGFGGEFDDLASIGSLALIHAAEDFDESKGVKFSTFAHKYIKNEIIEQSKRGGLIRVPIYSDEQYYNKCERRNRLDRFINKKNHEAAAYRIANLSDFKTDSDFVVIPRQLVAPEQLDAAIASELRDFVRQLKDTYRRVVVKHFWGDMSFKEIGEEMGWCRFEVSRKKNMAVKQLQKCYGVV